MLKLANKLATGANNLLTFLNNQSADYTNRTSNRERSLELLEYKNNQKHQTNDNQEPAKKKVFTGTDQNKYNKTGVEAPRTYSPIRRRRAGVN